MKCPKCSSRYITSDGFCEKCKFNVAVFLKIKNKSIKLYNKALGKIVINDFSGAIECLNESIIFDKKNYLARNLLGLCYYEVGRMPEAVMHWVISSSFKANHNYAKNYIDAIKNGGGKADLLFDSVRMYNITLSHMQNDNHDLALIQLKKIVEINPDFVDALCLFALYHMINEENDKAISYINKVLSIDVNNQKALRYYNAINKNNSNSVKIETVKIDISKNSNDNIEPVKIRKVVKHKTKFFNMEAVAFILGIVLAAAVLMTLVFPGKVVDKNEMIAKLESDIEKLEKSNVNNDSELSEKYVLLENEIAMLKEENEDLAKFKKIQEQKDLVFEAEALSRRGLHLDAANAVIYLDKTLFDEETVVKYEYVERYSFARASETHYNTGRTHYSKEEFLEALNSFEIAVALGTTQAFVGDAIYYLGLLALDDGDYAKAKNYFQEVIANYSNATSFKRAQEELEKL